MKYLAVFLCLFILTVAGCAHQRSDAGSADHPAASAAGVQPDTEPQTSGKHPATLDLKNESEANASDTAADKRSGDEAGSDDDFFKEFEDEYDLSARDTAKLSESVADPIQPFNRAMFWFNDKLYFYLLKPAAQGYQYVTPTGFRYIVSNFFDNLLSPRRVVSCMLQGKLKGAGYQLLGFVMNSTVGIGGFFNPAGQVIPSYPYDEDLGQTFGWWGAGEGFYLVLPVLGPTTLRDGLGRIGDMYLSPTFHLDTGNEIIGLQAFKVLNETSLRIGDYESIKDMSLDPYVSLRNFYVERRRVLIAQ
jgi:phospholipid-binding lipoprotein MlaA